MLSLLLSFLSGFFVSLTDRLSDKKNKLGFFTAIAFGLLLGFLISQGGAVSEVLAGGFLGVLIAGKLDSRPHLTGAIALLATLGFLGLPIVNPTLVLLFTLAALIDEYLDERLSKKKFVLTRPLLPFFALLISLASGKWEYFTAIALFDLGYLVAGKVKLASLHLP